MAKKTDLFSNKGYGSVIESAANTLTFSEIQTNVSIFEKVAWVLHRIEWYFNQVTHTLLIDGADHLEMALVASNNITDLGLDIPAVIDVLDLMKISDTGVGFAFADMPKIRDFSNLPGGGLIIAPRPLYLAVHGTSLANPATVACRFYFTQKTLSAEDYLDLIDFYRIVQ